MRTLTRGATSCVAPCHIRRLACCLALVIVATASGQFAEPYDTDPAARKAFEEIVQSYRARPGLEVSSTLAIELVQGESRSAREEVKFKLVYGGRGTGRVAIKGFDCLFHDGAFTVTNDKTDDGYFRESYEGSPYWPLLLSFQDLPYPHLGVLWGEDSIDDVLMQLQPQTPMIVPTSVKSVVIDGQTRQELVLSSPHGALTLFVDPKTKLIQSARHEITGGPLTEQGVKRVTTYTFEHVVHEQPMPADTFAFDPGPRQRVDLVSALAPAAPPPAAGGGGAALAGKPAPPFILATSDGKAIDLADLEGKVVVLDFWATWCGPCRRALPILHEVAAWTKRERLPVEIITINVWESRDPQNNTPDERLKSVRAYWEKSGFTLPVAMDYTDEVAAAYGVTGIPATFVIRSDGVVHAKPHATSEALQESIMAALQALEAGEDG